MAYLENGHNLEDVIKHFKQKWRDKPRSHDGKPRPVIKNVRRFAMNAIRQTTGYGLYDNYIVEHADRLWTPRNPIIAEGEDAEELKLAWKVKAIKGRYYIVQERTASELEAIVGSS